MGEEDHRQENWARRLREQRDRLVGKPRISIKPLAAYLSGHDARIHELRLITVRRKLIHAVMDEVIKRSKWKHWQREATGYDAAKKAVRRYQEKLRIYAMLIIQLHPGGISNSKGSVSILRIEYELKKIGVAVPSRAATRRFLRKFVRSALIFPCDVARVVKSESQIVLGLKPLKSALIERIAVMEIASNVETVEAAKGSANA